MLSWTWIVFLVSLTLFTCAVLWDVTTQLDKAHRSRYNHVDEQFQPEELSKDSQATNYGDNLQQKPTKLDSRNLHDFPIKSLSQRRDVYGKNSNLKDASSSKTINDLFSSAELEVRPSPRLNYLVGSNKGTYRLIEKSTTYHDIKTGELPREDKLLKQRLQESQHSPLTQEYALPNTPPVGSPSEGKQTKAGALFSASNLPYSPSFPIKSFTPSWLLQPALTDPSPCLGRRGKNGCIVYVHSTAGNFHRRDAVRNTWGKSDDLLNVGIQLCFILGKPASGEDQEAFIKEEFLHHKDLIMLDMYEHSFNLSFKSLAMLDWVHNHRVNTSFVIKSDDDVFINPQELVRYIKSLQQKSQHKPEKQFLVGHVIENAKPNLDPSSKYFVPPSLYSAPVYPPYLSGSTYIIPYNTIQQIRQTAKDINYIFWLEDVYMTGFLAPVADITLVHEDKIHYHVPSAITCEKLTGSISYHGVTTSKLKTLYKKLKHCLENTKDLIL